MGDKRTRWKRRYLVRNYGRTLATVGGPTNNHAASPTAKRYTSASPKVLPPNHLKTNYHRWKNRGMSIFPFDLPLSMSLPSTALGLFVLLFAVVAIEARAAAALPVDNSGLRGLACYAVMSRPPLLVPPAAQRPATTLPPAERELYRNGKKRSTTSNPTLAGRY